jgi:hypothetical protein
MSQAELVRDPGWRTDRSVDPPSRGPFLSADQTIPVLTCERFFLDAAPLAGRVGSGVR